MRLPKFWSSHLEQIQIRLISTYTLECLRATLSSTTAPATFTVRSSTLLKENAIGRLYTDQQRNVHRGNIQGLLHRSIRMAATFLAGSVRIHQPATVSIRCLRRR